VIVAHLKFQRRGGWGPRGARAECTRRNRTRCPPTRKASRRRTPAPAPPRPASSRSSRASPGTCWRSWTSRATWGSSARRKSSCCARSSASWSTRSARSARK
jgi:hypothetical protein